MTATFVIVEAGAPRKLIWFWGIASAVFGAGLTRSGVFGSTAEASTVCGTQAGEAGGVVAAAAEASAAIASSTIAATVTGRGRGSVRRALLPVIGCTR